jgi:hypothetical protein
MDDLKSAAADGKHVLQKAPDDKAGRVYFVVSYDDKDKAKKQGMHGIGRSGNGLPLTPRPPL